MSSKEATPAKADDGNADKPKSVLNPREEELFKVAMLNCLKGGPPEIDMEKFVKFGNFNTTKTAQNTWGKIKAKLPKPDVTEGEDGDGAPKTPKAKATPRKRKADVSEADADYAGDAPDGSPKKKVSKTPAKKTPAKKSVKKEKEDEAAEEGAKVKGEDAEDDE